MQIEIDQGEGRAEPVMVLRDATIAHPVEAEDALQDAEHMFYFRSYFRLGCVLSFCFLVHIVFELRPAAGHVLRVWRGLTHRLCLALIAAVAVGIFVSNTARKVHIDLRSMTSNFY